MLLSTLFSWAGPTELSMTRTPVGRSSIYVAVTVPVSMLHPVFPLLSVPPSLGKRLPFMNGLHLALDRNGSYVRTATRCSCEQDSRLLERPVMITFLVLEPATSLLSITRVRTRLNRSRPVLSSTVGLLLS